MRLGPALAARVGGVLTLLVAWQLAATLGLINSVVLPGPVTVISESSRLLTADQLLSNIGASIKRAYLGFLVGAGVGATLGIAAGWYPWVGRFARVPIELLRPVPPLAWIPIAIVWFGLGDGSKVFVIALGSFFPMVTNAYKGMVTIEPLLLRAGQALGLRGRRLLVRVAMPAIVPDLATGARVGWALSFASLVAAEFLAADSGLGFLILNARRQGQFAVIILGIVLIGVLALLTEQIFRRLAFGRHLRWQAEGVSR